MALSRHRYCTDHPRLLDTLASRDFLIIQDIDGVCMGLVRDPLTRRLEARYVQAAQRLADRYFVLTNGEHVGRRGLNLIVEAAVGHGDPDRATDSYLPGLAAGGVQLQNRHGEVSHPGVSAAELDFLRAVPDKAAAFMHDVLTVAPFLLPASEIAALNATMVLDNLASPSLNLNPFHARYGDRPALYAHLQQQCAQFMLTLQQQAEAAGLGDSFFVHYAPNLGRDDSDDERIKLGAGRDAGTTDFQFMLKGAIKETGVLVLLNHHYFRRTGRWPLGEEFNARAAPRDAAALLHLAREHFDPKYMPCLVGVGDTVTSIAHAHADGTTEMLRGGSDRGFLSLVQELGRAFDTDNAVLYVDSSRGEVRRPGLDAAHLQRCAADPALAPWPGLQHISDPLDPLSLNFVFPGGHEQYVDFFCTLAQRAAPTSPRPRSSAVARAKPGFGT